MGRCCYCSSAEFWEKFWKYTVITVNESQSHFMSVIAFMSGVGVLQS